MYRVGFFCGVWAWASLAVACPFCSAVKSTFAQQRETAVAVVLGEKNADGFRVHRVWPNDKLPTDKPLKADVKLPAAATDMFLLLAQGDAHAQPKDWEWSAVPVDEVTMAYYVRAPDLRAKPADRLAYFAKFLENADPGIAEDAYAEFGHAPFSDVSAAAAALPQAKLRAWVADPGIQQTRQGFYGMALGLAQTDADRTENTKLLRQLIAADKSDFRAGFDGQIAGLLLLEGEEGLKYITQRILANPQAAIGNLKHAQTALRFYHEFGTNIRPEKITAATRLLLDRPVTAAAAIIDLARWRDWESAKHITTLWSRTKAEETDIRLAIVGFLHACPETQAAKLLAELRQAEPSGVATAEREFQATAGGK